MAAPFKLLSGTVLHDNGQRQHSSFTSVVDGDDGGYNGSDGAGGGREEQGIAGVGSREREKKGSGLGERESRLKKTYLIYSCPYRADNGYRDPLNCSIIDEIRGEFLLLFIETLSGR